MKKIINLLSMFMVLFLGSFLFVSKARADILPPPGPVSWIENIITNQNILLVVIIGILVLISWIVIRVIKRKKK